MTLKRLKRKIDHLLARSLLRLSKRQRFVVSTALLTIGLVTTQLLPTDKSFAAITLLTFFTFLFTVWCLWEELEAIEYITLIIPPMLYTIGLGLFYFLLPLRWITRVPVAILFAIGMYAFLLTENIFNVAAIRTIALLRAARAVNLLFLLITVFFLFSTLFSFHLASFLNFAFVSGISFLTFIPSFWSEKLTPGIEKEVLEMSIYFAVVTGELAFILSFWPIKATFEALYLISICYTLISLGENRLKEMPIKRTILEYAILNFLALGMLLRTASWKI